MKKLLLFLAFLLAAPVLQAQFAEGGAFLDYNYTRKQYGEDNLLHLRNADVLLQQFDFEGAFFALENAVAQAPQSADAYIRRAIFRKRMGMDTEAKEDLQVASRLNPYAADLYGYNGSYARLNLLANRPQAAFAGLSMEKKINYYYTALDYQVMYDKTSKSEMEMLEEVVTAIEDQNLNFASSSLTELIGTYPSSAVGLDLSGMLAAHNGDYENAIKYFQKATELQPDYALAWYNLGRAEKEIGNLEKANTYFDKAIDLQNNLSKAYFEKALVLKSQGKLSAAIEEYDQVIELSGGDYLEAYLNRGLTRKMQGDFTGAVADLNRVIESDRSNPQAYLNRGNAYLIYGYLKHALEDYTTAIQLDENYAEAYYNRGLAQFLVHDKGSGCYDLDRAYDLGYEKALEKRKYFCVE